jgi:hypothetical protein
MKKLVAFLLSTLLLASMLGMTASAKELPFTDLPDDPVVLEAVQYVYDNGLMNGTGATTCDPGAMYTRAMFGTMLGRLEGIDTAKYPGSEFKDVAVGNWATPYVNWAAKNNIVNGVGNGMFAPGDLITEEQYCTIVCRYMDSKGIDFPGEPVWMPEIVDADDISTWALPSVINMVYYNLVDLTDDFFFLPKLEMNRATIAYYFMNLHRMLQLSVTPQYTHDPAEKLEEGLDGDDIISITRAASAYVGNWFYFNSYCDGSQTVENGLGTFEKVLNPYIHSKQAVVDQGYKYFLTDISQQFAEEKAFLEQGYELYLSKTEGLGGFMIDRAHIDVYQEDASYILTISYYAGDELMYTQETRLFYDSTHWVFTDLIDVQLATADIDIAWG